MSADLPAIRDAIVTGNVVFGSFSVSLSGGAAAEAPRLPEYDASEILQDGVPDLFSALRWDYGLAGTLRGREADLAAILAWAEDGKATIAARLISGPGGAGKTRLAVEAARTLRRRGWAAGLLRIGADSGRVIDASGRAPGAGLLLIIDYPEERMSVVEAVLRDVADVANPPIPIRLLLVSRRGFADWEAQARLLRGRFGRQELATPGPLEVDDALGILTETAITFARIAGCEVPLLDGAPAWLADSQTRRLPLFAMAGGLHAVLTGRSDFALGASDLMRELAMRELDRVRPISQKAGLGEHGLPRLLALALFSSAGLDQERLQRLGLAEVAPGLLGQGLLDAVAGTPWWRHEPAGRHLIRLEPDRPAAAFLEQALLRDPSPSLPNWIFAACGQDASDFGQRLSRLAYDLAGLSSDGRGAALLERAVLAMIQANPERATAFRGLAEQQATTFTAGFAAEVLRVLLIEAEDHARAATSINFASHSGDKAQAALINHLIILSRNEKRAGILNNLAVYLARLGRREEALAAAQEAAELYRSLAADHPDSFASNLASSLNNLASRLGDLGHREEALAVAQEVVELYRTRAATQPDAFSPGLAGALDDLASRLGDLGHREEALAVAQEAVELYRTLAATQPDPFASNLASSLNNLASRFTNLGHREKALAAAQEGLVLRRALASSRPDAFAPKLANSLTDYAICLAKLGHHEEALATVQEAVELRRTFAAALPDAFTPDLALVLSNLAIHLGNLGHHDEALAAAQEGVEIRRALAAAQPDAFTPGLAVSLHSLANRLSSSNRLEEALAAAQEVVEIRRALAAAQPSAFAPDLAFSLGSLANILSNLDYDEEALATAWEAVDLLRPYFLVRPAAFAARMRSCATVYVRACEATGIQPSFDLLEQINQVLAVADQAGDSTRAHVHITPS